MKIELKISEVSTNDMTFKNHTIRVTKKKDARFQNVYTLQIIKQEDGYYICSPELYLKEREYLDLIKQLKIWSAIKID